MINLNGHHNTAAIAQVALASTSTALKKALNTLSTEGVDWDGLAHYMASHRPYQVPVLLDAAPQGHITAWQAIGEALLTNLLAQKTGEDHLRPFQAFVERAAQNMMDQSLWHSWLFMACKAGQQNILEILLAKAPPLDNLFWYDLLRQAAPQGQTLYNTVEGAYMRAHANDAKAEPLPA